MLDARTITRRSFMRRVLGAGVGLLSLEFVGGTLAFLWPNITEGLGATFRVARLPDLLAADPDFARGYPYSFTAARSFLINVPAARALASGDVVQAPPPSATDSSHCGASVPTSAAWSPTFASP